MSEAAKVPGLLYTPDWVTADEERALLAAIDAAEWSTQLRRRVQHYGMRYDYTARAVAAGDRTPLPAWSGPLAARLDFEPDQVIVNEYEPGQGISAHTDCVPCFGPAVAAVSLGSGCAMTFSLTTAVEVYLSARSLCVMSGAARYEWRHAIAARKSDPDPGGPGRLARGRRVSVTFRTVLTP
jgi:alkylated DNA repair dioxygenase AlkB